MNKLALLVAVVLLTPAALAGSDILPDRSVLDEGLSWHHENDVAVVHVLHRLYESDVMARSVVIELGRPEYGVGVSRAGDEYRLVGAFSPVPVSSYKEFLDSQLDKTDSDGNPVVADLSKSPPDVDDVIAEECNTALPSDVGVRLIGIWKVMLRRAMVEELRAAEPANQRIEPVRPADQQIMGFGRMHYYSVHDSLHLVGARVFGWYMGSDTGKLVELSETMAQYCRAPTPELEKQLTDQTSILSAKLKIE